MKKLLTIAFIVLAVSCLTQATEIVKYDFGSYPTLVFTPTIGAEHITAGNFSYVGDGSTSSCTGNGGGYGYQVNGGWLKDGYLNYFSFTISIESGWSLNLDKKSVKFDASPSTMTGPRLARVTYLGNPEIAIGSEIDISTSGWWTFGAYENPPITGLTGTIEFRIYARDATDGGILDIDNVTLNGTLIPEPATIALLSLGALSLLRRKK
jgi:hypothetical protein